MNAINPTDMLSIVIITRDTKEFLQQLLYSIEKDESLKSSVKETIIIDNASADGTGDMVHNEFPWATYDRNDKNMGFASSANQGINQSTGEYALLLNSDTILLAGEITKMLGFMEENDDVGICGPQLVYPDMRLQRSSAPIPSLLTELLLFRRKLSVPNIDNRSSIIDNRASSDLSNAERRTLNAEPIPLSAIDVPSLIGAAMMIRKSLFRELSGFDEQFFFFLEETDLCVRTKQQTAPNIDNRSSIIDNRASSDLSLRAQRGNLTDGIATASPRDDEKKKNSRDDGKMSNAERHTPNAERDSLTPPLTASINRVVLLPEVKVIHLQGKTVGKNWVKGRIEYNISLYKFIKKHHSDLYCRSFQTIRFSKSIIVILVLSLLPFLLISKRTRRNYKYYWNILLWHLTGCPDNAGLRPPA